MDPKVKLFILLICSPLMVLFLHMVALRLFRGISPQIVAFLCAVIGNFPLIIVLWFVSIRYLVRTPFDMFCIVFYCMLIYNALSYMYLHIFNMSETARRIRILYEIYSNSSLTREDVISKYKTENMLSVRLERLISMRQLARRGDRYVLNQRLLYYVAKILVIWRQSIGILC